MQNIIVERTGQIEMRIHDNGFAQMDLVQMAIMESVYGGIDMTRQFQHLGSGGVPTGRVYKMNTVVYAVIPNHIDIFGSTACIGNDAFGGLEFGVGRVANPHSEARNCNRIRGIL